MNLPNPFKNTYIEFHIIQSFPVTCLNRDDVGAPKTAIIGGSTRARVSPNVGNVKFVWRCMILESSLGYEQKK